MTEENRSTALAVHVDAEFRLGLEPKNLEETHSLCVSIVKSGLFKVTSPEDAMMRVLTARSLGLPAIVGLRKMHTIEGKLGMDADLVLALCLRDPACEAFEFSETTHEKCTIRAKRKGRAELVYTYAIEDAKRALLVDRGDTAEAKAKSNWNRQPRNMLRARAVTDVARMLFPDATMGMPSIEELRDERETFTVDNETGEVLPKGETKSAASPPETPPKDWKPEAEILEAKLKACASPDDFKAARRSLSELEGKMPPLYLDPLVDLYNAGRKAAKEAAAKGEAKP